MDSMRLIDRLFHSQPLTLAFRVGSKGNNSERVVSGKRLPSHSNHQQCFEPRGPSEPFELSDNLARSCPRDQQLERSLAFFASRELYLASLDAPYRGRNQLNGLVCLEQGIRRNGSAGPE